MAPFIPEICDIYYVHANFEVCMEGVMVYGYYLDVLPWAFVNNPIAPLPITELSCKYWVLDCISTWRHFGTGDNTVQTRKSQVTVWTITMSNISIIDSKCSQRLY